MTPPPEQDRVELLATTLDIAACLRDVSDPKAGGIDVFVGTTRAERRGDGVELIALHYEAYAEMAVAQMRALLVAARQQWPIARACLLHRLGRVDVGEPSVVIAVACPHRDQAFAACRFLIDELKKSVTIWKQDVWADGKGNWKGEAS